MHEIGPTTTHKAQIIESILQGKRIPEVARLHNHSGHNVERYYRGYNAVETEIFDSEEVQPGVIPDFNKANRVVGIEILNLSTRVTKDMLSLVQLETV